MEPNDIEMLKEKLDLANKKIKELSQEIDSLSDEVEEKSRQIAKYENAKKILKMLLSHLRKAEQLERITRSDLAYDLWHYLREATALAQEWVKPSLHVSISDTEAGIVTKYTIRNF